MADRSLAFLKKPAYEAAPLLLGCELERTIDGKKLRARIVETEAYDQTDVASHSYKGKTPRSEVMFGRAGHLYVYFTYGMHYCCNVVTGPDGHGAAVLIRAVEPLAGEAVMSGLRGGHAGHDLTNGPAKFCQAFAIDRALNGHDLTKAPLKLIVPDEFPVYKTDEVVTSTRIGISRAQDVPWRFYVKDNPYISKP
ncbi:MAG TPA: DNA-3-methyladenine glycosylase [Candidatus Saccharimonadales bacterium]|nr:DNA-3-methyladenine glycosylase [Candidatus Saccharimonadales bacterium]